MKDMNCRLDLPYPDPVASSENEELAERLSAGGTANFPRLPATFIST